MATMRNRNLFPPGEWQMLHPEAGQKEPWKGSFSEIVNKEADFRARNPALVAKYGWSLNEEDIANDVDSYNAQRMLAGGFFGFVDVDAVPPASSGGERRAGQGALAAAANSALTGLAIYRELFSHGTQPVPKGFAELRAATCASCPLNHKGGLREFFVESIAKGITELYGVLRDLDLTTSRDKDLGTCTACSCPTRAKVHVPLDIIVRHMKPDVRAKLDPRCWITQPLAGS
jgi:hypothetical protein